ncbi:helix-turn-helix domain-containing protein [Flavobacterium foetidum]|uniref:helix-turn-helix domain-containing protein n=1 Tax=Flavobacterium foetidum TaxID=2026681 RepID=UPI0010751AB7|nr:helix-turn-helix transcriptional regulator [Flavobacterium foetidum]KAF2513893.1 helix-turn-helix transcriptional regulator [Flavobacterium foetidum]
MVNIDDFVKRLEAILDYYGLNASAFADKIGVQRSSMSHLLSGRNKPSLDFIMKIIEVFPDVDLYWILNGTGNFPKLYNDDSSKSSKISTPIESEISGVQDLFSSIDFGKESKPSDKVVATENLNIISKPDEQIEKIVFFYRNGTFKVYNP